MTVPSSETTNTIPPAAETQWLSVRARVLAGPDFDKHVAMTGDRLVIGTHEAADFPLTDPTVSRFHCEIVRQGKRLAIRDLGSRNGTIVDSVAIREALLTRRSVLSLGATVIAIDLVTEPIPDAVGSRSGFGIMVGSAPVMTRVFAQLERAAKSDVTVLLTGETGTGKEAAAESLHRESARRNGPFIVVDCGAIPAELLESELFGHDKGAFTGAVRAREGAFQAARGGTIFLDEIGELPRDLQPKLLRVLSRHAVKPVGQEHYTEIDVRVVAATNRDLREEVNAERFREDLYYRLAVVEVQLPPLRERLVDIGVIVETVLRDMRGPAELKAALMTEPALTEMRRHHWPGNVRELQNFVARRLALGDLADLEVVNQVAIPPSSAELTVDLSQPLKEARDHHAAVFERAYLTAVMREHGGNVRAAGVDRVHLYRLLSKHGMR